jgi:hypothetical protein
VKFAPKNRVQRALVAGAGVLALLATAGCSAVNEQATTRHYSASDGIVTTVGPVNVRNLLIVAENAKSAGHLLGTVANTSDSPVKLDLTVKSSSTSVTIPANGRVEFEDSKNAVLNAAGAEPGALVPMTVRVNSEASEVKVPVLNGALAEYSQYLQTPKPTSSASASAEPTESASGETTTEPTAPASEAPTPTEAP